VPTSDNWAAIIATFKPATTTSHGGATTTTASTVIRYVFTDHLGGSTVITDASSTIVETMDYYPYGAPKFDTKVGSYGGEKRKYASTEYDAGVGPQLHDSALPQSKSRHVHIGGPGVRGGWTGRDDAEIVCQGSDVYQKWDVIKSGSV